MPPPASPSRRRSPAPARPGLRERKKEQTRQGLADAAWEQVYAHGYEGVTVDQIAEAADVSRSTFFRYFPSKEAVLFTWREALLERFQAELEANVPGESGFDAVRRALLATGELYQRDRAAIVKRQRVINASPALVGHEYEVDRLWEDAIAARLLAQGGRSAAARRRALLQAGAVLGILRVTLRGWIADRGRSDLLALGREALQLVERLEPDIPAQRATRRSRR